MANKINKFKIGGQFTIDPYAMLGSGTLGQVYQGFKTSTKQKVAIKIMSLGKGTLQAEKKKLTSYVNTEKKILQQVKHENVLFIHDIILKEQDDIYYLIYEKCDINLAQFIKNYSKINPQKPFMDQNLCIFLTAQICNAFKALSQSNVLHRDLKPQNILFKNGVLKIADFGVSKISDSKTGAEHTKGTGTPFYNSFEVLSQIKYTQKCDVWSLGCIFYKLLNNRLPWENQVKQIKHNDHQTANKKIINFIQKYKHRQFQLVRPLIKKDSQNFLSQCLEVLQEDRPSWKKVFNFPLLSFYQMELKPHKKQFQDYIKKLTQAAIKLDQNPDFKIEKIQAPIILSQKTPEKMKKNPQQKVMTKIKNKPIQYYQLKLNNMFSFTSSYVDHFNIKINFKQFFEYDWSNLQKIQLGQTEINDKEWRLFIQNVHLLPKLHTIYIQGNMIENIQKGDLEKLEALKRIDFNFGRLKNPLNSKSKKVLKEFVQKNKQIQVAFDQTNEQCQNYIKQNSIFNVQRNNSKEIVSINHSTKPLDIKSFVKNDWPQLTTLSLNSSNIDDQCWRLLVQASNKMPKLNKLALAGNKIKNVRQGDLQRFPKLKIIWFCFTKGDSSCPLTNQSQQYLERYKKKNPQVKITWGPSQKMHLSNNLTYVTNDDK